MGYLKLIRSIYMYSRHKVSTIYQLGLSLNGHSSGAHIYIHVYVCFLQTEWNVYCYKQAHKCRNKFLSGKRCTLGTFKWKFHIYVCVHWKLFFSLHSHSQCTLKVQCRSITYIQQMYQFWDHIRYVWGQLSGCLHSVQLCHWYRGLW